MIWECFKTACLMLNVCSIASLEAYSRQLMVQWLRCWRLIYTADDAGRAERLEKLQRRFTMSLAKETGASRLGSSLAVVMHLHPAGLQTWSTASERVIISAAGWIAAGGRGAPTVALKAAVLDTIQGGHKALQAEHEPAGQSGNGRRTQANRDRRQTKKRRLPSRREELARHRSSSTNQEKSGPSPKGKGRESQRTNRAKRYASAGLREGERSHLEVNAGEPSKECANADCACHRLTRSQIAGQPERKT